MEHQRLTIPWVRKKRKANHLPFFIAIGCLPPAYEEFEAKLKSCVTERYESVKTTFQRVIETEGEVVVALTHKAENSNTWMGFDVSGKDVTWTSLTYFRFNNEGKIIEEIVERNELSMANQLGLHLDVTKERN